MADTALGRRITSEEPAEQPRGRRQSRSSIQPPPLGPSRRVRPNPAFAPHGQAHRSRYTVAGSSSSRSDLAMKWM